MLYECSQNARGMAAEYGSSVQEFKQNAAGIPRIYFECTWNVTRMSQGYENNMAGIGPIEYKMSRSCWRTAIWNKANAY